MQNDFNRGGSRKVQRADIGSRKIERTEPASARRPEYGSSSRRLDRREERHSHTRYSVLYMLFYPLAILYSEFLLKAILGGGIFDKYFFVIFLFALSGGALLFVLCNLSSSRKVNRGVTIGVYTLFAVIFLIEFFCKQFFGFYMGLRVIFDAAGDVVGSYTGTIFSMVIKQIYIVALFFLPVLVYIFFLKKPLSSRISKFYAKIFPLFVGILGYVLCMVFVFTSKSTGIISNKEAYRSEFNMTESSYRFGLLPCLRVDIEYWIFGTPKAEIPVDVPTESSPTPSNTETDNPTDSTPPPVVYDYNIRKDIDFASLIANAKNNTLKDMHTYFSLQTGTKQNEYTGLFKGKNLIIVVAEAFSHYVIDKDRTPTLYRLANEGIVVKNYYQPAWGVSTSDGEYSSLIGLIPKSGVTSMQVTADNNNYYTMGNQLSRLGYYSLAFHNNSHTYYKRNLTHIHLGYSKFIALGSGMEGIKMVWPRSDLEMMQNTVDLFINNQPFNIYYLTVSGHAKYTFEGNMMAYKNRDKVASLNYSDHVKAYFACNLELEYAMEYLVDRLEQAGIADDTVIVLGPDHYPYGLEIGVEGNTVDYLSEMMGHTVENNFEKHKNALIIWSGCLEDMDPIVVEDPCYSIDILPTISNLFGTDYDSRLMVGRDILSDSMPLVIFRNYSWITDKGFYNAKTETFEATTDEPVSDEYIANISKIVKAKVTYSKYILEEDYYGVLFGN